MSIFPSIMNFVSTKENSLELQRIRLDILKYSQRFKGYESKKQVENLKKNIGSFSSIECIPNSILRFLNDIHIEKLDVNESFDNPVLLAIYDFCKYAVSEDRAHRVLSSFYLQDNITLNNLDLKYFTSSYKDLAIKFEKDFSDHALDKYFAKAFSISVKKVLNAVQNDINEGLNNIEKEYVRNHKALNLYIQNSLTIKGGGLKSFILKSSLDSVQLTEGRDGWGGIDPRIFISSWHVNPITGKLILNKSTAYNLGDDLNPSNEWIKPEHQDLFQYSNGDMLFANSFPFLIINAIESDTILSQESYEFIFATLKLAQEICTILPFSGVDLACFVIKSWIGILLFLDFLNPDDKFHETFLTYPIEDIESNTKGTEIIDLHEVESGGADNFIPINNWKLKIKWQYYNSNNWSNIFIERYTDSHIKDTNYQEFDVEYLVIRKFYDKHFITRDLSGFQEFCHIYWKKEALPDGTSIGQFDASPYNYISSEHDMELKLKLQREWRSYYRTRMLPIDGYITAYGLNYNFLFGWYWSEDRAKNGIAFMRDNNVNRKCLMFGKGFYTVKDPQPTPDIARTPHFYANGDLIVNKIHKNETMRISDFIKFNPNNLTIGELDKSTSLYTFSEKGFFSMEQSQMVSSPILSPNKYPAIFERDIPEKFSFLFVNYHNRQDRIESFLKIIKRHGFNCFYKPTLQFFRV